MFDGRKVKGSVMMEPDVHASLKRNR